MVVFTRIDDRLIHGQVVEGWVNFLKATSILVADDRVASNALQRSIMEISVPQGLTVYIGTVEDICSRLRSSPPGNERAILLFSTPADVVRALKLGLQCSALNIGGMHYMPGKRKLIDVLAVDEADLEALRTIAAQGVKVEIQTVPTQKPLTLDKLFKVCRLDERREQ
jgi:mannose/fructose/N-acetylgalactosamine-specific phosphotransferase system component IIB